MKKILTLLLSILLCLSLFGCNNKDNEEEVIEENNTTQEVAIDNAKQEETITEVVEETTQEEVTTLVEETTQEETTIIEEPKESTKPTINAKSYALHVGVADGITLIVKRISSKVGADLITIKPETTKLYEGDVIEVSVSTSISLNPVYAIDNATNLNNNQYTINASDVTITTGYDYEKHESSASAHGPFSYTLIGSGTVLTSDAFLATESLAVNFTSNSKNCYAYNGYVSQTHSAKWIDACEFVRLLNENQITPINETIKGGGGTWRLLDVYDGYSLEGTAWKNATNSASSDLDGVTFFWSFREYSSSDAYYWKTHDGGYPSYGDKASSSNEFGFVVIFEQN